MNRVVPRFFFCLLLITNISADMKSERPSYQKDSLVSHYAAHLITEGIVYIPVAAAFAVCMGGGMLALSNNSPESALIGTVICGGGLATGSYIFYKVPAWTDDYILDYKVPRTSGQNLISALSRLILQWPFGTLAGEFLAHLE